MSAPRTAGLDDFEQRTFCAAGIERRVFYCGEGPPVVLLHELPGLCPLTLTFARERLCPAGFSVHLPVLFGPAGQGQLLRNTFRVCLSKTLWAWRSGGESPLLAWLTALCRDLQHAQGGPGVGVIGMCITGHFAIAMLAEPDVAAAVTCQPTVPLWPCSGRALGVGASRLARVRARAEAAHPKPVLLGLRFVHDRLCPQSRFTQLGATLGTGFEPHEIPGWGHSTLIEHFDPRTDSLSQRALARVVAFLQERLLPPAPVGQPGLQD